MSAEWAGDRPKSDVDALGSKFFTHCISAGIEETTVPSHGSVHAYRERRGIVSETDTQGGVLETQRGEIETRNGTDIADAVILSPTGTGGEID